MKTGAEEKKVKEETITLTVPENDTYTLSEHLDNAEALAHVMGMALSTGEDLPTDYGCRIIYLLQDSLSRIREVVNPVLP